MEDIEVMSVEEFLSSDVTIKDAIENDYSATQIIDNEIKAWGIKEDTFTYTAFMALTKISVDAVMNDDKSFNYTKAVHEVAKLLNKKEHIVSTAYSKVAKNYDFSNAKFIPVLKRMDREDITPEFIVKQLFDFVIGDE